MIRTNSVEFRSRDHRNTVNDAVKGRGEALTNDDAELRSLFDVAQTLEYVEMNEPYDGALLTFPFAFESEETYRRAVDVLTGQTDDDLDWLGRALDEAGVDEDFDPDSDYGNGGVREAIKGRDW